MEEGFFFFLEILVIKSTEPLGSKCIFTLPCMLIGIGRTREKAASSAVENSFLLASDFFVGLHFLTVQLLQFPVSKSQAELLKSKGFMLLFC